MFFQNSESNRSRLGINRIIDGFFTVVEPSVCFSGLGRRLIFCQIFLTSVGYVLGSFVMNTLNTKPSERKRNNKRTQSRTEILIYIKCVYLRDLKVEDKYSIILTEDFIKSVIYLTDVK